MSNATTATTQTAQTENPAATAETAKVTRNRPSAEDYEKLIKEEVPTDDDKKVTHLQALFTARDSLTKRLDYLATEYEKVKALKTGMNSKITGMMGGGK